MNDRPVEEVNDANIREYLDSRYKYSKDHSAATALDLSRQMEFFTDEEYDLMREYLLRCVRGGDSVDYCYMALDVLSESPRTSDTKNLFEMFLSNPTGWSGYFRASVVAHLMALKFTEGLNSFRGLVEEEFKRWRVKPCDSISNLGLLLDHLAYVSPTDSVMRSAEFFSVGFQLSCKERFKNLAKGGTTSIYTRVEPALIGELIREVRSANADSANQLKRAMLESLDRKVQDKSWQNALGLERLEIATNICRSA